jgi:putative transposase
LAIISPAEHPTREGKVYCAVVLDTWSRRVVGWSIDSAPSTALVTNALGMAIDQRRPHSETIIHSDQGTQVQLLGVHTSCHRFRSTAVDGLGR